MPAKWCARRVVPSYWTWNGEWTRRIGVSNSSPTQECIIQSTANVQRWYEVIILYSIFEEYRTHEKTTSLSPPAKLISQMARRRYPIWLQLARASHVWYLTPISIFLSTLLPPHRPSQHWSIIDVLQYPKGSCSCFPSLVPSPAFTQGAWVALSFVR